MLTNNKIGRATITINGASLQLEATFSKLKALQDMKPGMDAVDAVRVLATNSTGIVELFHLFQVPHQKMEEQELPNGEKVMVPVLDKNSRPVIENYDEDTIYNWLLGDLEKFMDPAVQDMVSNAIATLMGVKYQQAVPAAAAKTTGSKKKTTP